MSVNPVNAASAYSSTSTKSTGSTSDLSNKDVFLKILSAELSNQDPLNASNDSTQQIAQLAQFSSLEQSAEMNTSISEMLLSQKITEGTSLIGKNVGIYDNDGKIHTEKVSSVKVVNNNVYVVSGNGTYSIDSVGEVSE